MDLERRRVARAMAGDGDAFASLVRPHLAMLFRVASRTCADPALAEDAVQESLLIAARQLGRYAPGTSLKAWLAAIVSQRAWTLLRGELRRKQREQHSARPQQLATPEEELRARRAAQRVRNALHAMPHKRREAAILRLDGGLSYKEIAQALETSTASARVLVHLALKSLRHDLSDLV